MGSRVGHTLDTKYGKNQQTTNQRCCNRTRDIMLQCKIYVHQFALQLYELRLRNPGRNANESEFTNAATFIYRDVRQPAARSSSRRT